MASTSPLPDKPSKDYPLTPHRSGKWCKRINGKLHYFGRHDDPKAALLEYLSKRDMLLAGLTPTTKPTVQYLFTLFQESRVSMGLSAEYTKTVRNAYDKVRIFFTDDKVVEHISPVEWAAFCGNLTEKYAPSTVRTYITVIRSAARWAYESDILEKPVKFGPSFRAPSLRAHRVYTQGLTPRVFSRQEMYDLLEVADEDMTAWLLTGLNCAFGLIDMAGIQHRHLDDTFQWVTFPRPKTGIDRKAWLWPETQAAVVAARQGKDFLFVTRKGKTIRKSLANQFAVTRTRAGIDRDNSGFYALRHTAATVASTCNDPDAVRLLLGHADSSMLRTYTHSTANIDERIKRVCTAIREWLFNPITTTGD